MNVMRDRELMSIGINIESYNVENILFTRLFSVTATSFYLYLFYPLLLQRASVGY